MSEEVGHTEIQETIFKLLSGQNASQAIANLNYCISYITGASKFTYLDKSSLESPSINMELS